MEPASADGRVFHHRYCLRIRGTCEAPRVNGCACFPTEGTFFPGVSRRGQIPASVRKPCLIFLATLWSQYVGFQNQMHGYAFARVSPVQTNCLKHAFVQVPAGEEKGQCKIQWLFYSHSSCFVVSKFLPRAKTMGGSLWRRILLFCHQHLGLGGCLACSPKGTLSVTSHFPATEFRESWILYRGGKTYFSTSSSLTDSDFPLQPAVGWVIFCEIQTSRVTWLFAVQNEFFWMFLYDLGWGENSNIQASVINILSNMSNCVSNLHSGFILHPNRGKCFMKGGFMEGETKAQCCWIIFPVSLASGNRNQSSISCENC